MINNLQTLAETLNNSDMLVSELYETIKANNWQTSGQTDIICIDSANSALIRYEDGKYIYIH